MAKSDGRIAEPEQNDVVKSEEIELQVIPYAIGPGPGRPLFLTPRRFLTICKMIERGSTVTAACRAALVSYSGFRNHVTRQPLYAKRLKKAEECRDNLWRSEALEAVRGAFGKNWVSAMTFLERRYPAEFSLRRVDRDDPQAAQPVGDRVPLETLIEDARIAAEVALQRPPGLPPATESQA
jgi:hypothetical protein